MNRLATDRTYLQYQYGTTEKLKIRQETHLRYSERQDDFIAWVLAQADVQPGQRIADLGCGPGAYFPQLASVGANIVGVDMSPAMLADAAERAKNANADVELLQANTEWLPLASNLCDRVMANHVLYHVPDQVAALREIRRIVNTGGRVVLATNAADASRVIEDIHDEVAIELGYEPGRGVDERFNLDHLSLVRGVFPTAQVVLREDAFVFPNSEAALRYYASGMIDRVEPLPTDGSHHARFLPLVKERLDVIVAEKGELRVPKNSGCFVADVH